MKQKLEKKNIEIIRSKRFIKKTPKKLTKIEKSRVTKELLDSPYLIYDLKFYPENSEGFEINNEDIAAFEKIDFLSDFFKEDLELTDKGTVELHKVSYFLRDEKGSKFLNEECFFLIKNYLKKRNINYINMKNQRLITEFIKK